MTVQQQQKLNSLPFANSANRAVETFARLAGLNSLEFSGAELLYERANILGLTAKPRFSPNGSCRLIESANGLIALNLPRDSDWDLITALLGPWFDNVPIKQGDWNSLEYFIKQIECEAILNQAHQLGMAASSAEQTNQGQTFESILPTMLAKYEKAPLNKEPLVVDLSSLWAGPLCGQLLLRAGCQVIKVEANQRLDGARNSSSHFYSLLNQGKKSVTLDFQDENHISRLRDLLDKADIIIEGSRPHALRNKGIIAEEIIKSKKNKVWLSITAYGRDANNGMRIGFGDDAAVAAGLSHVMYEATGEYQIVGDAIADPLTGIHSALSVLQAYRSGEQHMISVTLKDTVEHCLQKELRESEESFKAACRAWQQYGHNLEQVFTARSPHPEEPVAMPGEHNHLLFN